MHRALEIEIEKEWIRGEIIISEIARIRKLMMESGLALEMGSNGFPFSLSQQMDIKSQLDFSQLGTRVENMSLEERITNYLCREELQKLRISEDVTIADGGNESHEHNFQIIPSEDVPIPKSEVLRNAADLSELSSGVSMERADGKCCSLCHVTITNERSLNEHMQGKKHRLKLQTKGIMKLNTSAGVKPTVEPILLGKTGEDLLMEENLASFQGNLDLERLKENECAFVQNVDCSCAPCEINSPDEQAPNEHLSRKKINMKKGMVNVEVAGRKSGVGLSPKTAAMLIVDTIDPCMEEEVDFMANHLLPMKTSGTRLKEHELPPLQDNISSGVVYKETHSTLNQKIEWSCALCHVVAPNEQDLNKHLQGRKHKRKEAALLSEGTCKNSGIKPSSGRSTFPAEESMDPSETLLLKEAGEPSLKEELLFQDNKNPDDLTRTQVAFGQKVKWSCPLCEVVVSSERSLNEHLQGKKHKLKGTGSKISRVAASDSVQVVQTSCQRMDEGVMCTSESLSHYKVGKTCLEEWNQLAQLLQNLNKGDLNDLVQGKKHQLKEAGAKTSPMITSNSVQVTGSIDVSMLGLNSNDLTKNRGASSRQLEWRPLGNRKNCIIGPPQMAVNNSDHVAGTIDLNGGSFKFLAESLPLQKSEEANLEGNTLPTLQDDLKSVDMKINQSAVEQKVECGARPQVTPPYEWHLNEHMQGKKHRLKEAALRVDGTRRDNCIELSAITTTHPVVVAGSEDVSVEDTVKLKPEVLLTEKVEEANFKAKDLTSIQEKLNSADLTKKWGASSQKLEWRIKQSLKDVAVAGSEDVSVEDTVKFKPEVLLIEKVEEANFKAKDLTSIQEKLNSADLTKKWGASSQKLEWRIKQSLKDVASRTEMVGNICDNELSPMTTNSVQVAGSMDVSMVGLNSNDLTKNRCTSSRQLEWRPLGNRKNRNIGHSQMSVNNSDHVAGTIG